MNFMTAVQFHWYGFIVGLAAVIGWWLVDSKLSTVFSKKNTTQTTWLWVWIALGVVIGARGWHVVTDWQLYQDNLGLSIALWQGGLSIVGAVMGGLLGLFLWWWLIANKQFSLGAILDTFVFGLPVAQALGRVGNYVNQELYGWPSSLPWAIPIEAVYRLPNVAQATTFHPLFLYEGLAVVCFWLIVRWWSEKKGWGSWPSGLLFSLYIGFYACIRFALDFFRVSRGPIHDFGPIALGSNQIVMLLWYFGAVAMSIYLLKGQQKRVTRAIMAVAVLDVLLILITFFGSNYAKTQQQLWQEPQDIYELNKLSDTALSRSELLEKKYDHGFIYLTAKSDASASTKLRVEVVNSVGSLSQGLSDRKEIGSDGMLFVFPQARQLSFWMRRMQFDLDMIWIKDNVVVGVTPGVPHLPPDTPNSQLLTYPAPVDSDMVLEVLAGQSTKLGFTIGTSLEYSDL